MQFSRKMLEIARRLANYERRPLHALLALLHTNFLAKVPVKVFSNRTHFDAAFMSAILDRDGSNYKE